jgi:hypothetical protein
MTALLGTRAAIRRGHTLIELVVSLPLMVLLLAGLAGAILLSGRAIPDGSSPTSAALDAGSGLDQLAAELRYATAITTKTATALTFTVADRTGDAAAETIAYAWSGTAGDPLTRVVNGSTAEPIVPAVQSLAFTYTTYLDAGSGNTRLSAVHIAVTALPGSTTRLDTSIRTLNAPVVP